MITIVALLVAVFAVDSVQGRAGRTYTTNFAANENPISEGGNWLNGKKDGIDWKDMRTSGGLVYGTQDGTGGPPYDDSTAVISGAWGPDQSVEATVHMVNSQTGNVYQEVEIRLRTTITAHDIRGYEIMWRANHDGTQYHQIGGGYGPINVTIPAIVDLRSQDGYRGIFNGDVVKATIVGNVIRSYVNGVQIAQVTDNTFANGNPGVGHWLRGPGNTIGDYGFTSLIATDQIKAAPRAPMNVRIMSAMQRMLIGSDRGSAAATFALLLPTLNLE